MTTDRLNYFSHAMSHNLISNKPFYFLRMPVNIKCYKKLKESVWGGENMDRTVGMFEKGKMFGRWRIWVATTDGIGDWDIEGDFTWYEILWDYAKMKKIYPRIMKENPHAKEYYTVYLNDPDEVSVEEQKTWILFR